MPKAFTCCRLRTYSPLSTYRTPHDDPTSIASDLVHTLSFFIHTLYYVLGALLRSPRTLFLYSFSLTLAHSLSFLLTPLTVLVVILLGSLPYQG